MPKLTRLDWWTVFLILVTLATLALCVALSK